MDRTMYGKIDPGARNPYRCIREKGLPPGCKFYFFPTSQFQSHFLLTRTAIQQSGTRFRIQVS